MIARLRGRLVSKQPGQVVVDVGGIGYRLFVPLSTYYQLPPTEQEVSLRVFTHVRDDAIHLYGFHTLDERVTFELLTGVSGIGPRLASNILSGISVEELSAAILEADLPRLKAIPGVGRKTGERVILELKDKILEVARTEEGALQPQPRTGPDQMLDDVVSALMNLGCHRKEATRAAEAAREATGGAGTDFEKLVKEALKLLAEGAGKRR
jgi:Holliday junction DNA helicase RuvA